MDYVEISNSMIVYLLCGITVAIAFIQAVLYIRMAKKMTVKANIPATVPKTAFRVGLISAIGPALGVFIVMVGLMTSIGGPMAWQRLSIIGAAPTELTAAKLGAEVAGVTFGGADYTTEVLALSWITMTLNGCGWLLFVGLFAHKLEKLRVKVGGGDSKWLVVLSGASTLGVFGYLNAGDVVKGHGNLISVIFGALGMILFTKYLNQKFPKIKEYSLGIAMLFGMVGATLYDILLK